jgi:hypothetical protein
MIAITHASHAIVRNEPAANRAKAQPLFQATHPPPTTHHPENTITAVAQRAYFVSQSWQMMKHLPEHHVLR